MAILLNLVKSDNVTEWLSEMAKHCQHLPGYSVPIVDGALARSKRNAIKSILRCVRP